MGVRFDAEDQHLESWIIVTPAHIRVGDFMNMQFNFVFVVLSLFLLPDFVVVLVRYQILVSCH